MLRVSRRFDLPSVRVTEGKISVNVWRKSRRNRFWFESERGSSALEGYVFNDALDTDSFLNAPTDCSLRGVFQEKCDPTMEVTSLDNGQSPSLNEFKSKMKNYDFKFCFTFTASL